MNRYASLPAIVLAISVGQPARAQSVPQSYGQYYGKNASKSPNSLNPDQYLYDKYFYRSKNVSPYVNLDRPGNQSGDAYSTWVRPEKERRQQATRAAKTNSAPPASGPHNNDGLATGGQPGERPGQPQNASPYFNQYYQYYGDPAGR